MDRALEGKVVWVTGARKGEALARILERHGAEAHVVPTMDTQPLDDRDPAHRAVRDIAGGRIRAGVFLTGVGVRALLSVAESIGLADEVVARLNEGFVVARGAKARSALRSAGIRVDVEPEMPTSDGILAALAGGAGEALRGLDVVVQLHGREQPELLEGLRAFGARPVPVPLYRYVPARDEALVLEWVGRVERGEVYAVTFTSPPAVLGLFATAGRAGREGSLVAALRERTVVAAVGPSTAETLEELGTPPHVVAEPYTHPALVAALVNHALGAASLPGREAGAGGGTV
ncbi:MAG TPA: uroporphyrinogen-III synthase [Longimicrobiales bacterium]